jgi:hypothetical protein
LENNQETTMSNIVPFESAKLPAFLRGATPAVAADLTANVGAGFAVMSIKGKNFTVVKGGEREMLMKPGQDGDDAEPATSIQVVLIKANAGLSKVWYAKGFVEGSEDKPDCFSHDGVAPDSAVESPQAKKCAVCPKNQWGSKTDESGKKLKACSDSRRVAISTTDAVDEPLLLRVPPASLKPLAEYGQALAKRGVPYNAVITRIGFDREASTPKLTFKALDFVSEELYAEITEATTSEVVTSILGRPGEAPINPVEPDESVADLKGTPPAAAKVDAASAKKAKAAPVADPDDDTPAPAPAPKKAKAAPAPVADPDDDDTPAPAPKKAAAAPSELESELDDVLGALDD